MKRRWLTLLMLIGLILSPLWSAMPARSASTGPVPAAPFKAGEILVRFRDDVSAAASADVLRRHAAQYVRTLYRSDVQVLSVPVGRELEVVAALNAEPSIVYAEPDYRYAAFLTPDDPHFGKQWAHTRVNSVAGWDISTGSSSVTIAIIDSGIDETHPDLAGKLVSGYDFVDSDSNPHDLNGHGTHVAGVAAAVGDNAVGVTGMDWTAKIMPVRVLNHEGWGYNSDITQGIIWAYTHGADVLNLSLGGASHSQAMQDAVTAAHGAGSVVIAAMGNCRYQSDSCPEANPDAYPAKYDHVMAVSATGPSDAYTYYSQYGAHCDIAAPGGSMSQYHDPDGIYSTMPTYDVELTTAYGYAKTYDYLQGTSQATPYVAGLAALILAVDPGMTPDNVMDVIEDTAQDLGASGRDDDYGHGLIDVAAALQSIAAPEAPTLASIDNADGDGAYIVSWNTVANATGYTLQEDSAPHFPSPTEVYDGANPQHSVSGQGPGRWYYRVRAYNDQGTESDWSNVASAGVTPDAPTLAPIDNATYADAYQLSWTAVTGADGYTLEQDDDPAFGDPAIRYQGEATAYDVTGQPGGTWHYRVLAYNLVGDGPWSISQTTVVTPSLMPAPVLSETLNADQDGRYTLAWRSVSGALSYTLEEDGTSYFAAPVEVYAGPRTAYTVTGQSTGAWHYRVRAHGAASSSPWSNARSVKVYGELYLPLVLKTYEAPAVEPTPTPSPTPSPTPTEPPTGWLGYVNAYRTMASLPAVTENATWSHGDELHAKYMVKNDVMAHTENPSNPWYTDEGLAAAQSSNLFASSSDSATDEQAIDGWMQAPFHAVGVLDPELLQVGYGAYREADGGYQTGAGLDVIRGLGDLPASITFPIPWPGDGTTVGLTQHWGETPDPLTSCPGYSAPSGLPIILQIGPGNLTPDVTAHTFTQGSTSLDHCIFDETDYANSDSSQQSLGRSILNSRDAIVLIPRDPLTPGATYSASITVNGETHTWSFTVASSASTTRPDALGRPPHF